MIIVLAAYGWDHLAAESHTEENLSQTVRSGISGNLRIYTTKYMYGYVN